MSTDFAGLHMQIMANAKLLLGTTRTLSIDCTDSDISIVVFGSSSSAYTAAVMLGTTPAIEGAEANTAHQAVFKLLSATCELLATFIPKLGAHQRNIHGGGIFDEDLISPDLIEAQQKAAQISAGT